MVYCSYCGTQNREGSLKCIKCGKPLALFSDEDDVPQRSLRDSPKNSPRNISRNSSGNISMNT
ncbi:MAG: zinc-ribbon domain-containing protein, partial [Methanobrevibacter sp.]|nr:zinc-ribbon domain-containing protein [Methanobrevibacter sp.]